MELLLNSRVLRVSERAVAIADKAGSEAEVPCGACVWVAGVGAHPLVKQLQQAFPDFQKSSRCEGAGYSAAGHSSWQGITSFDPLRPPPPLQVCADRQLPAR